MNVLRRRWATAAENKDKGSLIAALGAFIVMTMIVTLALVTAIGSVQKTRDSRDFVLAGQMSQAAWQDAIYVLNNGAGVDGSTEALAAYAKPCMVSALPKPISSRTARRAAWKAFAAASRAGDNWVFRTTSLLKDSYASNGDAGKLAPGAAGSCWTWNAGAGTLSAMGAYEGSVRIITGKVNDVRATTQVTTATTVGSGRNVISYSVSPADVMRRFTLFANRAAPVQLPEGSPAVAPSVQVRSLLDADVSDDASGKTGSRAAVASNGRVVIGAGAASATLYNAFNNPDCASAASCQVAARVGSTMSVRSEEVEDIAAASCVGPLTEWRSSSEVDRQALVATPAASATTSSRAGSSRCYSKMVFEAGTTFNLSGAGLASVYVRPGGDPDAASTAVEIQDGARVSADSQAVLQIVVAQANAATVFGDTTQFNGYLYSPYAGSGCSQAPEDSLVLTGALACDTIDLGRVVATPRSMSNNPIRQHPLEASYVRTMFYAGSTRESAR